MRLPNRSTCFACGTPATDRPGQALQARLRRCHACAAEWLEGTRGCEQGYEYIDYGTGEDTNAHGHAYLLGRARRFAAYLREIPDPPGRLLDVGCGPGEFLMQARAAGWDAVGVELTDDTVALARERTGLRVLAGDLTNEELIRPASFDVVTLWGVLEHLPDPAGMLDACRRILRPDGVLMLETPNAQALFRVVARGLMRVTGGRVTGPFEQTLGAGHVVWYSAPALDAAATRAGFRVHDLRGSRNSTRALMSRWDAVPVTRRLLFQLATAVLNHAAVPLGRPNQLLATLRRNG